LPFSYDTSCLLQCESWRMRKNQAYLPTTCQPHIQPVRKCRTWGQCYRSPTQTARPCRLSENFYAYSAWKFIKNKACVHDDIAHWCSLNSTHNPDLVAHQSNAMQSTQRGDEHLDPGISTHTTQGSLPLCSNTVVF